MPSPLPATRAMPGDRRIAGDNSGLRPGGQGPWPPGDRAMPGDDTRLRRRIAADNSRLRPGGLWAWPPGDLPVATGTRRFGRLSFFLKKKAPRTPKEISLFCVWQFTHARVPPNAA